MVTAVTTTFHKTEDVVAGRAKQRSIMDVRRRISPESGRAIELLGHAIEYLADELAHDGNPLDQESGRMQAIQLLMAANRSIYMACPRIPTLSERIRTLLSHSRS